MCTKSSIDALASFSKITLDGYARPLCQRETSLVDLSETTWTKGDKTWEDVPSLRTCALCRL